jgi:hypothetical protein
MKGLSEMFLEQITAYTKEHTGRATSTKNLCVERGGEVVGWWWEVA